MFWLVVRPIIGRQDVVEEGAMVFAEER